MVFATKAAEILSTDDQSETRPPAENQAQLALVQMTLEKGIPAENIKLIQNLAQELYGTDLKPAVIEEMITDAHRLAGRFRLGTTEDNLYKVHFAYKYAADLGLEKDRVDSVLEDSGYEVKDVQQARQQYQRAPMTMRTPEAENVLSEREMRQLAAKYFPADQVDNALAVARVESGWSARAYRPEHKNPGGGADIGLMQINTKYHPKKIRAVGGVEALYNPEINMKVARQIYDEAGGSWRPWYGAQKLGLWVG